MFTKSCSNLPSAVGNDQTLLALARRTFHKLASTLEKGVRSMPLVYGAFIYVYDDMVSILFLLLQLIVLSNGRTNAGFALRN